MKTFETKHYIFSYLENSVAEKEINEIAKTQEKNFTIICETLKVCFKEKIHYFLLDSKEEVGKLFGDNMPCNGFANLEKNEVFAVYNEEIKCIGPHEDSHIISLIIGNPKSDFLAEGLAMFFDKTWWDIDNDNWVSYYKEKGLSFTVSDLLTDDKFYEIDCALTYPIAGSFTKFLINEYGIDKYIEFYKYQGTDYLSHILEVYKMDISQLEDNYWKFIDNITIEEKTRNLIIEQTK